jgi:outer membrane protein insertion porin family
MRKSANGFRGLLLAIALVAGPTGLAAGRPAPPATIVAVAVVADGAPVGPEIESLVPIAPGDPYSEKAIDAGLKQIFQTGLFSDIRVLREGETSVRLTYVLTRKLVTRSIGFEGGRAVSRAKLRDGLYALRPGGAYSEERMARAADEVRETLRKEGFFNASVTARSAKDPAQPYIDVTLALDAGRRFTIKAVDVEGDASLLKPVLSKKIESREGRPFSPSVLEADIVRIKDYFGILGYPRAEVGADPPAVDEASGTVGLMFRVVPNERIRITIRGADVPESLVRPVWEERVFEEWGLLQSEAKIVSFLRNQGYIFATVSSRVERDAGELRIAYDVNPGRKYTIGEADFEGLHFFTPVEIKKELNLGLSLVVLGGIPGERLFELPAEIRRLYETKGFDRTLVDLNFRKVGTEMRAIYKIEEGLQRTCGQVAVRGVSLFDAALVRAQLQTRDRGPFYQPDVQRDIGRLETFYQNQGFRGTTASAAVSEVRPDVFDVTFDIREGRRVKVDRIVITGNRVTRRATIDRELKIREGEWASADRIQETKRNLEKLGIFAEVKVEEIAVSPDAETLVLNLREGERNYFSLGAGLETKTQPQSFQISTNDLRPRGTAELILGNVLGQASQLSFVTQFSLSETRVVAGWEDRYLFGLPLQTLVNAWIEREELVSYGFDQRGLSFTAIKPFGRDWTSFTTLRWASTTLYFLEVAESQVDRQHYPYSATSLSESVIRDSRDDTFNPARGGFFSAVLEWAYPLFMAESNFIKASVKYQRYVPISQTITFSVTARGGLGYGQIPIHERFFAGGSNTFRGQPFDRLGPEDPTSLMPVGGKALLLLNLELTLPLFPTMPDLSGAVFYDKGNVFRERRNFDLADLQDAVGVGIRYRTPLGPVRLDLGWNLRPPEGRKQPIIFITIGNVF